MDVALTSEEIEDLPLLYSRAVITLTMCLQSHVRLYTGVAVNTIPNHRNVDTV